MRRALLAVFLGVLLLGAAGSVRAQTGGDFAFANFTNDPLYDLDTYQRLRDVQVYVPREDNVDLKTVLRDLRLAEIKSYPDGHEIDLRFDQSVAPADRLRKVNLQPERAPLYSVLLSLGQQASFDIKVRRGLVYVVPRPLK